MATSGVVFVVGGGVAVAEVEDGERGVGSKTERTRASFEGEESMLKPRRRRRKPVVEVW